MVKYNSLFVCIGFSVGRVGFVILAFREVTGYLTDRLKCYHPCSGTGDQK